MDNENSFEKLKRINPSLYNIFLAAVTKVLEKNHDYAGDGDFYANLRDSEEIGIPTWKGILVRWGDKVRRIKNFAKKPVYLVKDENFIDSCIDAANYILFVADTWKPEDAEKVSQ